MKIGNSGTGGSMENSQESFLERMTFESELLVEQKEKACLGKRTFG